MLKLLLAGTPQFSVPIFEELIKNFNVVGIVSQPDKPANRGHKVLPTATKLLAQKYNIKCYQPNRIKNFRLWLYVNSCIWSIYPRFSFSNC